MSVTRAHASDVYDRSTRSQLWRRPWTPAENSDETDRETEYGDGTTPDASDVDSEFGDSREDDLLDLTSAKKKRVPTFSVGCPCIPHVARCAYSRLLDAEGAVCMVRLQGCLVPRPDSGYCHRFNITI